MKGGCWRCGVVLLLGRLIARIISAYLITTIDGPASKLRTKKLSNKSFAVAVTGKASPDGTIFNPETTEKPRSSAREYDRLPVRSWDHYIREEKNATWFTRLEKHEGRYSVSSIGFINALQGTGLENLSRRHSNLGRGDAFLRKGPRGSSGPPDQKRALVHSCPDRYRRSPAAGLQCFLAKVRWHRFIANVLNGCEICSVSSNQRT